MTEPEVPPLEVSTINENEYASASPKRKTIEDTEISTVNETNWITEDIMKLIYLDMPPYKPKKIADVSLEAECLGGFLTGVNEILAFVVMILIHESMNENYGKTNLCIYWFLTTLIYFVMFEAAIFIMESTSYQESTRTQENGNISDCNLPKTDKGIRQFINYFMVYDIFKVSCFLIGNFDVSLKIAVFVYVIFNRLLSIGIVFHSRKFCRCPVCYEKIRPEDVRIIYGNKAMNMKSKTTVTILKLQEYFGISLINGAHLGLMNASGAVRRIWYSVNPQPGQYILKILT